MFQNCCSFLWRRNWVFHPQIEERNSNPTSIKTRYKDTRKFWSIDDKWRFTWICAVLTLKLESWVQVKCSCMWSPPVVSSVSQIISQWCLSGDDGSWKWTWPPPSTVQEHAKGLCRATYLNLQRLQRRIEIGVPIFPKSWRAWINSP